MEIFFYTIIFIIGITFGSFYTLAVYRIPKKQDITHTHSYCTNCKHKLEILDLIPVFSYILLGGKCRYCKQKIRPRYLILEIISGSFFVILAFLMDLTIYNLDINNIIEYAFYILYFTFIILMAGIDKENRMINKSILIYGLVISIMYMIYLYIIQNTIIYRYVIYLILFIIILIIDILTSKKSQKNKYTYSILMAILIMAIYTGEYITINTIIICLLTISIYLLMKKLIKDKKQKDNMQYNTNIKIAFILAISNIFYFLIILAYYKI